MVELTRCVEFSAEGKEVLGALLSVVVVVVVG